MQDRQAGSAKTIAIGLTLLCLVVAIYFVTVLGIRFRFVGLGLVMWFTALFGAPAVLCLPGWRLSCRRGSESVWLLFCATPAMLVWFWLSSIGVGAQSLANLVEFPLLAVAGVVSCYVKVFVVDKWVETPRYSTYGLVALLVAAAVLLRLFMPSLPE